MSYTTVSTKIDLQTKKKALQTASELGMPLSAVLKALLKQFIKTKTVNFTIDSEEEPTEYMIESLRQSEEDVKAGRVISFKSGDEALKYIDSLIKDETKRKYSTKR
jgi:addiction module RelB/DinJ family antitoxin